MQRVAFLNSYFKSIKTLSLIELFLRHLGVLGCDALALLDLESLALPQHVLLAVLELTAAFKSFEERVLLVLCPPVLPDHLFPINHLHIDRYAFHQHGHGGIALLGLWLRLLWLNRQLLHQVA